MESEAFADVDEGEKARFLGAFFQWVRHLFSKEADTPKPPTPVPHQDLPVQAPPPTFAKKET